MSYTSGNSNRPANTTSAVRPSNTSSSAPASVDIIGTNIQLNKKITFETVKFDLLYGKLLGKGIKQDLAKQLAVTLYRISAELEIGTDEILQYVNSNGLRFDNTVYQQLNRYRTNSSQIGYLDPDNIPPAITQQVV